MHVAALIGAQHWESGPGHVYAYHLSVWLVVQVALPAKQQKLVMPRVAAFHATTPRYPAELFT